MCGISSRAWAAWAEAAHESHQKHFINVNVSIAQRSLGTKQSENDVTCHTHPEALFVRCARSPRIGGFVFRNNLRRNALRKSNSNQFYFEFERSMAKAELGFEIPGYGNGSVWKKNPHIHTSTRLRQKGFVGEMRRVLGRGQLVTWLEKHEIASITQMLQTLALHIRILAVVKFNLSPRSNVCLFVFIL